MITEKTKLKELPQTEEVTKILAEFGVPCISCPYAQQEMDILTLDYITEMYDLDLKGLLKKLNEITKDHN